MVNVSLECVPIISCRLCLDCALTRVAGVTLSLSIWNSLLRWWILGQKNIHGISGTDRCNPWATRYPSHKWHSGMFPSDINLWTFLLSSDISTSYLHHLQLFIGSSLTNTPIVFLHDIHHAHFHPLHLGPLYHSDTLQPNLTSPHPLATHRFSWLHLFDRRQRWLQLRLRTRLHHTFQRPQWSRPVRDVRGREQRQRLFPCGLLDLRAERH